jgi:hypothetical protein
MCCRAMIDYFEARKLLCGFSIENIPLATFGASIRAPKSSTSTYQRSDGGV